MNKMILLIAVLLPSACFASVHASGYLCVGANPSDQAYLEKIQSKLGSDYMSGVVYVRAETCSPVHSPSHRDACKAGPYLTIIQQDLSALLEINKMVFLSLSCELNFDNTASPVSGGSNQI